MHWEISETSRLAKGPPPRQKPSSYLFWGAARAPFGPVVSPMPQDPNASLSSVRSAPQSYQMTASIHRPSRQAQTHTLFLSLSISLHLTHACKTPTPRFCGFLATANWGCLLEPYCRAVCWLDNWFFSNEGDGNDFLSPSISTTRIFTGDDLYCQNRGKGLSQKKRPEWKYHTFYGCLNVFRNINLIDNFIIVNTIIIIVDNT